jgi:hypothetical protein
MKFTELAADYIRQHNYPSHTLELPIFSPNNKGVLWVGYPKPWLWIIHSDVSYQDSLYCVWYRARGRRKLKKIQNDLSPYNSFYAKHDGYKYIGEIHDPEIFNKIMEIVKNPPNYVIESDGYVAPPNLEQS